MQEVFKRYEKKYLLDRQQYEKLLAKLLPLLVPDRYSRYTICNVYFDTPDYALIRYSLEKPMYKEKLRLRSYGTPSSGDTVFVELKKKFQGVVYKRRVAMTLEEANAYLYRGVHPNISGQMMQEMDWFTGQYVLWPAVYLAYDRIAYKGREDAGLRVTFDTNIRCREKDVLLEEGDSGTLLLPEDKVLMEIKIPGVMPLWLAHILSELSVYPTSFSKYGTYYQKMIAGTHKYTIEPDWDALEFYHSNGGSLC